jgi:collagenase-like PrtC family protease
MTARLSLGPVFFHWEAAELRDFYFRIADEAAIEVVHVGEVVCSKRAPFFLPHLPTVVERLERAGKTVVLSSLALVTSERERREARELCSAEGVLVEANDVGTIALLAGRPHVVGPFVNVYNEATLGYFARRGAVRACVPAELPAKSIARLAQAGVAEIEATVWGRLPLAISARCFHARAHRLHKDGCQFVCGRDPEGLVVRTLDGEAFLAINGVQTLSYTWTNLVREVPSLARSGVAVFRLVPMRVDMVAVAATFRGVLEGKVGPEDGFERLRAIAPDAAFANGFAHRSEGRAYVRATFDGTE